MAMVEGRKLYLPWGESTFQNIAAICKVLQISGRNDNRPSFSACVNACLWLCADAQEFVRKCEKAEKEARHLKLPSETLLRLHQLLEVGRQRVLFKRKMVKTSEWQFDEGEIEDLSIQEIACEKIEPPNDPAYKQLTKLQAYMGVKFYPSKLRSAAQWEKPLVEHIIKGNKGVG